MIAATITTSIIGAILTMVVMYWVRLGRPMIRPHQEIRTLAREAAEVIASTWWRDNVMVPEHRVENGPYVSSRDQSDCQRAGRCVEDLNFICRSCRHRSSYATHTERRVPYRDMVKARMEQRMAGWSPRDVQRFRLYHARENQAIVKRDRVLAGVQAVSESLGRDRAAAERGRAELNGETDE